MKRNLTHALRALRRAPGFNLLIVLISALGIGVNTAIFTLVNAALLRPLPYRESSRLVWVSAVDRSGGDTNGCLSYPRFQFLAARVPAFSGMAAFTNETFSVSGSGREPQQIQAARVSWNFFTLLGVSPALGRSFLAAEADPGGKPVVLIGNQFWHRVFGAKPNITGQSMALDSRPYTIVGVLPASFQFGPLGTDIEVWTPRIDELNLVTAQQIQGGTCYLDAVARLASGVALEQARAEIKVLNRQYVRGFPKMGDADPKRPVEVTPLQAKLVGTFRQVLLVLTAAVMLVLLLACANIAGLLLIRALRRRREVAIRAALGAQRSQLLFEFLTESVVLALLGGVAGLLLGLAVTREMLLITAQSLPRLSQLPAALDWRVLAFATVTSLATGVLFGLAPALRISRTNVSSSLREEGRGTAGAHSRDLSRNILVAGQIALSLVLLVGAGLLIRSFVLLETQPAGFNTQNILTMNVALPPSRYATSAQMIEFFNRLIQRVEVLPGVQAAAVSSALPIDVARLTPILVEGQPAVPVPERPIIIVQTFTSSYRKLMQMPLIKGRFFDAHDTSDSPPVIVINQSFVRKFFPEQNPLGKRVWIGRRPAPAQIVGVIGDVKNVSLSVPTQPEFDVPFAQLPWGRMNLLLRTARDPKRTAEAVRLQIAALDRDLPVTDVRTIDELLAEGSAQPRTVMMLLAGFAVLAFGLAIIGLYGTISYSVAQRTQEMGVRIAVGATPANLLRLVLGYAAAITCAGILTGIVFAALLSSALEKLVYGIGVRDPMTFLLSALLFLACSLLASYIPARRAMRVDVIEALRE